jgi:uncharacterized membrane protein
LMERMRRSVLMVFWGWVFFVVAGMGFQKMTEYDDFVGAARQHPWIGTSFEAVVAGAWVALAAILLGGAPIAFSVLKDTFARRRKDVALLFLVPPLSLAAFVGYVLLLTRVIHPAAGSRTIHGALNVGLFLSVAGMFVFAAVASAAAISRAVSRTSIEERLFRFALYPAALTTVAMGVVLVAVVAWGLALKADAPALFGGDGGILASSTAHTWLAIVVVMGCCTGLAAFAVHRGFRGRPISQRDH